MVPHLSRGYFKVASRAPLIVPCLYCSKMQQKVFSETNLVVFVNEIVMSQTIAGTLNQAHDRMAAGSMGAGLTTARSSIMGSSNTKEHEMYV